MGEDGDLQPDPAVVEHLHELVDRLGLRVASRLPPASAMQQHIRETGHRLTYGCCSAVAREGDVRLPE